MELWYVTRCAVHRPGITVARQGCHAALRLARILHKCGSQHDADDRTGNGPHPFSSIAELLAQLPTQQGAEGGQTVDRAGDFRVMPAMPVTMPLTSLCGGGRGTEYQKGEADENPALHALFSADQLHRPPPIMLDSQ